MKKHLWGLLLKEKQYDGKEEEWEKMRKELHDGIFESLNLKRFSEEGTKFTKVLDEFCEPHIMKYDPICARAKSLSNARTDEEIKQAQTMLEMEMYKQKRQSAYGFRSFDCDDEQVCRVCGKDLSKGGVRINDHLATVEGFEKIHKPICGECSDNNPDAHYKAFKGIN